MEDSEANLAKRTGEQDVFVLSISYAVSLNYSHSLLIIIRMLLFLVVVLRRNEK